MITSQTLDDIKTARPGEVRQRAREALLRSHAFRTLPEKDRHQIETDLVQTLSYLADPTAGRPELARIARTIDAPVKGGSRAVAGSLADATEQLKGRLAEELHEEIRDRRIIDYHGNLSPEKLARDHRFSTRTEAWLAGDQ